MFHVEQNSQGEKPLTFDKRGRRFSGGTPSELGKLDGLFDCFTWNTADES